MQQQGINDLAEEKKGDTGKIRVAFRMAPKIKDKIEDLITDGHYASISEFLTIASNNQLHIHHPQGRKKKLSGDVYGKRKN